MRLLLEPVLSFVVRPGRRLRSSSSEGKDTVKLHITGNMVIFAKLQAAKSLVIQVNSSELIGFVAIN